MLPATSSPDSSVEFNKVFCFRRDFTPSLRTPRHWRRRSLPSCPEMTKPKLIFIYFVCCLLPRPRPFLLVYRLINLLQHRFIQHGTNSNTLRQLDLLQGEWFWLLFIGATNLLWAEWTNRDRVAKCACFAKLEVYSTIIEKKSCSITILHHFIFASHLIIYIVSISRTKLLRITILQFYASTAHRILQNIRIVVIMKVHSASVGVCKLVSVCHWAELLPAAPEKRV